MGQLSSSCVYMQDSNTPLHTAAAYGHLDTVKLLVQKRASLKRRNKVSHLISAHLQLFMIIL